MPTQARKQRIIIIADIGQAHGSDRRSRALLTLSVKKIVQKLCSRQLRTIDDVLVIFNGSARTKNALFSEEEDNNDSVYRNIEVVDVRGGSDDDQHALKPASFELARECERRAREFERKGADDVVDEDGGVKKENAQFAKGDLLDAITVAVDVLVRRKERDKREGKHPKIGQEVYLLSPCVDDLGEIEAGDEFVQGLLKAMRVNEIKLSCGVGFLPDTSSFRENNNNEKLMIGEEGTTTTTTTTRTTKISDNNSNNKPNMSTVKLLKEMVEQTKGSIEPIEDFIIGRVMQRKQPTTTFRGNLSFGKLGEESFLSIPIWAYKQMIEAKADTMKPVGNERGQLLQRTVEYKNIEKMDGEDIPPQQRVKCYKYGKQSIPINDSVERMFAPEKMQKGVEIIGTVDLKFVPFWMQTEEPTLFCTWPEISKEEKIGIDSEEHKKACQALSAFARALDRQGKCALCRACWRDTGDKGGGVHFGALTPRFLPEGDFLLFTPLPYAEDWRADQVFHENEELEELPKIDRCRMNIVGNLVDSMTLPPPLEENEQSHQKISINALCQDSNNVRVKRPWEMANENLLRRTELLTSKVLDPETTYTPSEKKTHALPGANLYFAQKYKNLPQNSAIGELPNAENATKRIKTSFKLISREEIINEEKEKEETFPTITGIASVAAAKEEEEKEEEEEETNAEGVNVAKAPERVIIKDTFNADYNNNHNHNNDNHNNDKDNDDDDDEDIPMTQPLPSELWKEKEPEKSMATTDTNPGVAEEKLKEEEEEKEFVVEEEDFDDMD